VQRDAGGSLAEPDAGLPGLLGDALALLDHRMGEPHDPLDPRAGGRGHLLGRLAGADAGLDDPRRQLDARVDVDLGQPAGVATGRGAHPVVDGEQEPLALGAVGTLGGQHEASPVVGERHEAQRAHGRTS
jgi:hypothetical protein